MEIFKNTFLFKLFRADKILFAVIAFYILAVLYYVSRQREEFPFFLYGMYSLKEPPQQNYYTYSITIGDQEIKYSKLRDAQRELITSTMEHAIPLIDSGKMSKADELKIKNWWMDYCSDLRLLGENKMNVYRLTCHYDEQGKISIVKKDLVYTYATE